MSEDVKKQENKVIDLTVDLWNEFLQLPGGHPDDVIDMKFHIHAIQRIIATRRSDLFEPRPVGSPALEHSVRLLNKQE